MIAHPSTAPVRARRQTSAWSAALLSLGVASCAPELSSVDGPTAEATRVEPAPTMPPEHLARVEAEVQRHEAARPRAPEAVPMAPVAALRAHAADDARESLVRDLQPALDQELVVADVTLRTPGDLDEYSLEPSGRYRVTTRRFHATVHGSAARRGLPEYSGDLDVFASRAFALPAQGASTRALVVATHRAARPGLHVLRAVPVSSDEGLLLAPAFGFAAGTSAAEVLRAMRSRAAGLPPAVVTGGAS